MFENDDTNFLRENIEKQLMEIEILKSIYANTNEFVIEDEEALLDAECFLETPENIELLRRKLGFEIKFCVDADQKSANLNDSFSKVDYFLI
jgi:hypothetical protein